MNDKFRHEEPEKKSAKGAMKVWGGGLKFNEKKYTYDERWVSARNPLDCHSTAEMIEFLRRDQKLQLEARVLGMSGESRGLTKPIGREQFLEWSKQRTSKKLKESWDAFAADGGSVSSVIGSNDFVPLIGGPFNRQLYYRDYLRMINASFYAYHHDPAAKGVTSILVDFTMGRGFQLHAKGKDANVAQVLWNVFAKVNNFHEQMDQFAMELSAQGEHMWWWLPNKQTRISFNPALGEKVPTAMIPRVRLLDPSNIAEIITIPEDIAQGVLYYVWLAPTQYQMYTRDNQPTTKFIYTQIPADQIMHVKVNSFSNEKRGRSDFFPALGYMKRLRDGVNYALVGQQKAAAWCIDTTIEGDENDIDTYISHQKQQECETGEHTAGSEFVHTSAIKREYLANSATAKGSDSPVFSWCLNMIAMASGIPISYLGTHLSGGSTRASALVATEPVAKRFERRQLVYERTVRAIFDRLMMTFNLNADCEIIFPELLTQDRSALFKDLSLAQVNDWIKPSRAAEIANKELGTKDFNFQKEVEEAGKEKDQLGLTLQGGAPGASPLTAPGALGQDGGGKGSVSSADRKDIKDNSRMV